MVTTTRLRILRLKYRIPLSELQKYCGFSYQYISQLELGNTGRTVRNERALSKAMKEVISNRRTAEDRLEQEFLTFSEQLLKPMEVESDEL